MRKTVTRSLLLSFIELLATMSLPLTAQSRGGRMVSSAPWPALPSWESLDDFSRNYFPRSVYEEARIQKEFDVLDITYISDGLPVRGLLVRPKNAGNQKWPAIILFS